MGLWAEKGVEADGAEKVQDCVGKLSFRFCLFRNNLFSSFTSHVSRISKGVQVQAINSIPPSSVNFDQPHPNKTLLFIASTFHVGDFAKSFDEVAFSLYEFFSVVTFFICW